MQTNPPLLPLVMAGATRHIHLAQSVKYVRVSYQFILILTSPPPLHTLPPITSKQILRDHLTDEKTSVLKVCSRSHFMEPCFFKRGVFSNKHVVVWAQPSSSNSWWCHYLLCWIHRTQAGAQYCVTGRNTHRCHFSCVVNSVP